MDKLLTSEYREKVDRLLERIESKRHLLQLNQEAYEPGSLNIDETSDLLNRYVSELDTLLRKHGLTVQLLQPAE